MGQKESSRAALLSFNRRTRDPWYNALSEGFLGNRTLQSLVEEAGGNPENLITLHTAMGYWAEGQGSNEKATGHYREALETFMDTWVEFEFARERLKKLRQPEK